MAKKKKKKSTIAKYMIEKNERNYLFFIFHFSFFLDIYYKMLLY